MAEKKLNINAPLMSVRRCSTTSPSLSEARKKILEKRHTLAHCNSDMSMDQVTEPVAVPFNWEHIPGRRKGNNGNGSEPQPPKQASNTPSPRLPPGKSTNATRQPLEKECKVVNKVRPSTKSNSFNGSVGKNKMDCGIERKAETKVENRRSNVEKENEDDDVFSDALETLSFTESFSMNCSVSGVSGLDTLDAKKSETFSSDQQIRDFMMSRFLPAAKAMTLQPPQYSSKKQSGVLVEQQPRDLTKLVREEKKPSLNKQITDIVPYAAQCQEEEESEEDEGGGDYDNSANISAKGCGLLPRLHIRNSLCLLNPVPGMKMKNQVSLPSASEVVKPNKISHLRSFSPVPAVKKAWDAIHKNKSSSGGASPDMQEGRKKWTSESNRFTYYSGELLPGRLSPFRRSRAAAAGVSPSRSKPQSPFRGARLPADPKEAEINQPGKLKFHSTELGRFREIPSVGAIRSSYSGNLTMEKTLYIDTASTVKLSSSNLSSVDNNQRIDALIAELDKRKGQKSSNSTSQNMKHVQALEEKHTLDSDVLSSSDANSSTLSGMLHLRAKEDKDESLTTDHNTNQEPVSSQLVQGTFTEDSKINTQQIVLSNDSGKGGAESGVSPLPPPLPKSPSESWLWRALPLVSVKNSLLHSNQGTQSNAKRHDSNTTSSNVVKWETIVKTSNLHHDHVRYSQELTTHKSQHSKS